MAAAQMGSSSSRMSAALERIPGPEEDVLARLMEHRDTLGGFADVLWDLRQQYGDVCRMTLAGEHYVNVFSPSATEKVFRNEGKFPSSVGLESWKKMKKQDQVPALKHTLLLQEGSEWKRLRNEVQRRILPPLEAQKFIPPLAPIMAQASKLIAARLTSGATLPLKLPSLLTLVTIESIATVVFGEGIGALENKELPARAAQFISALTARQEITVQLEMGVEQSWRVPGPVSPDNVLYHKLMDNFNTTWEIGSQYINEAKERMQNSKEDAPLALLPYLLQRGNLSEEESNGNVFTIFSAGVETTSVLLQWVLYWLAKNPSIQEKVAREIHDVLQGRDLSESGPLSSLPLMKGVLKETHRISPVVFGTARTLQEDIEVDGHIIPKQTRINIGVNLLGRDEKLYPNPKQFLPERWEGKEDEPFTMLPFGFGPRMCVGFRLATNEVYVFLARILQDWKLSLGNPSADVRGVTKLLTRPTPAVEIVFEPRRSFS